MLCICLLCDGLRAMQQAQLHASSGAIIGPEYSLTVLVQCLWLSMLVLAYSTRHLSARLSLTTDCCRF